MIGRRNSGAQVGLDFGGEECFHPFCFHSWARSFAKAVETSFSNGVVSYIIAHIVRVMLVACWKIDRQFLPTVNMKAKVSGALSDKRDD